MQDGTPKTTITEAERSAVWRMQNTTHSIVKDAATGAITLTVHGQDAARVVVQGLSELGIFYDGVQMKGVDNIFSIKQPDALARMEQLGLFQGKGKELV